MTVLRLQKEEEAELEIERFKRMLIAVHPREAGDILRAMDDESQDGLADLLSEEELEEAARERRSVEEIDEALTALRTFGLHVDS